MDTVVNRFAGLGVTAHRVWLPPLNESPTLDALLATFGQGRPLSVPIGLVDCPFDQRRDVLTAELAGAAGNVAIVGAPQSGKSTALRTLMMAVVSTHDPSAAQFYCLDFGGGALSSLRQVPHVGSVAGRSEVDLCRRTVAEMESIMRAREARFRRLGVHTMADYRRLRAAGEFRRSVRRRLPGHRWLGHATSRVGVPRTEDHRACRPGSFVRRARHRDRVALGRDTTRTEGSDRDTDRIAARRSRRLRDGPQARPPVGEHPAGPRHYARREGDGDRGTTRGRGVDDGSMGGALCTCDRTAPVAGPTRHRRYCGPSRDADRSRSWRTRVTASCGGFRRTAAPRHSG